MIWEGSISANWIGIHWQITQLGWNPIQGTPKTDASDREIAVDAESMTWLKQHERRQARERLAAGPDWVESGFVFTDEIGRPLHPQYVTDRFYAICYQAGLPPIRLHDLRHLAATAMLAAGADAVLVQKALGHRTASFTRDTYISVYPEAAAAGAEATAALLTGTPRTHTPATTALSAHHPLWTECTGRGGRRRGHEWDGDPPAHQLRIAIR
ncbi:tyrosine-type recombinase/integrase [Nonomuraea sp. NPDC059023]|uniref:tyrosine-type recombinase/integrase n=1 Tax=unclassified Nonomuraea TaxID=2593643 RepID=UPI00369AC9A1